MHIKPQNREIVVFSSSHPVYTSIMTTFEAISKLGNLNLARIPHHSGNSAQILKSSTNYLQYTKHDFDKKNLYLLHSPLIALGTWEALIRRIPFVGISEYMKTGTYKDALAMALFSSFKNTPFVVQTKRAKRFLEECGFKSVFLIPPAEQKRQGNKERKHILFVGRLIHSKNVFLFFKLARKFKDEKFVIIGQGPLIDTVREEAARLQNLQVIPFLKDREELFTYYSQAKILIHPAFKDPVGFVVVEALSTQTPTLVSSGVGTSDYLPDEWIANPNEEAEWLLKVGGILQNQEGSLRKAEEVFAQEHLDISDPFFGKTAESIYKVACSRWPELAKS